MRTQELVPRVGKNSMLHGLTTREVQERRERHGPNALPDKSPEPMWKRILRQFASPLIYILLFALAFDLLIWIREGAGDVPVESLAIAFILLLNAGLGVFQEYRAEAALGRLQSLAAPRVWALRDGQLVHIPSSELVPGDFVRLEAGDRVPADGRVLDTVGIMVDESILTGESVPVDKAKDDEVLSGTLLLRGKAHTEITRTGPTSNLGRLAKMLGRIESSQTPLERRLRVFGNQIARWVMLLALAITAVGVAFEGFGEFDRILFFTVALAVAAVPEGLPAVLTLTLSLGIERMSKRKAVVRRLAAVEALGSVTVIATDKTGTLTENRMQARKLDSPDTARALRAMLLANDAEPHAVVGDPLELALLEYGRASGVDPVTLRSAHPHVSSQPFDSAYKFMRVTVREDGMLVSYLKGAPEVLLKKSRLSGEQKRVWEQRVNDYATEGYRVLALAWREGESSDEIAFLGLVLLWDPPRPEVPDAIRQAHAARIRVVMVTGDHPATALAVAREVGIPTRVALTGREISQLSPEALGEAIRDVNVFARVAPEDKVKLVEAFRAAGHIVAMTGDGVNDAPALKRSDVGIAMGLRGSDVSREVADLVLLDDNFATIVAAIDEGRSIYENVQKFIRFLFSANVALVLLVVVAACASVALDLRDETGALLLPLTAVQLLWINLIANGAPALALGLDRNPQMMLRPPRDPASPLLDKVSARFILVGGVAKAIIGLFLLAILPRIGWSIAVTITAVFIYESIAPLVFAYPSRRLNVRPERNVVLNVVVATTVFLQVLTVLVPELRGVLGLVELNLKVGAIIIGGILVTWSMSEVIRWSAGKCAKSDTSRRAPDASFQATTAG
jgi:P-type Ca2+ transporter type 2C